jgi:hypothetical protein
VRKEKGIVVPEKFLTGREERKRDSSTEEISHGERADHTHRFLSHPSTHILMLHLSRCTTIVRTNCRGRWDPLHR